MNDDRRAVKQLDHLMVVADDARPLFELLSETFQLPVAWPLQTYPAFKSGGVTLGNLYLELLSFASQPSASSTGSGAGRFAAMAFEVDSITESLAELDRRRIPHGPVTPYLQREADGSRTMLYENVILGKMLGDSFWIDSMILLGRLPGASSMADAGGGGALVRWGMAKVLKGNMVFLVRFAYEHFDNLPHWSEFASHEEKRAADRRTLLERKGGVLGIESVEEIVAGVHDIKAAQESWSKLLAPVTEAAENVWEIADGPRVRLIPASRNAIETLVLKVTSLERARAVLEEKKMPGRLEGDQLRIAPEKMYGLDVRLVQ